MKVRTDERTKPIYPFYRNDVFFDGTLHLVNYGMKWRANLRKESIHRPFCGRGSTDSGKYFNEMPK